MQVLCILLLRLVVVAKSDNVTTTPVSPSPSWQPQQCAAPLQQSGQSPQQSVYRVGILALRGEAHARMNWTPTIEYLQLAVGSKFDPPLQFEIVPLPFANIFDAIRTATVDFFYVNPSMFSCMESELQAVPLVTIINKRLTHDLDQYAGVIFTKSDNNAIQSISDLKGKRVAATDISELGSGQMQFRAMQEAGLHHLQDPAQILFTANQKKVVDAVLKGQADAGFVRTDLLERMRNAKEGPDLDPASVRVIVRDEAMRTSSGEIFPFPASTRLYPEWAIASLPTVDISVSRAVQASLLDVADRASIAPALLSCYDEALCDDNDNKNDAESRAACHNSCFEGLDPSLFKLYDTTPEVALKAFEAMKIAKYAGFRPSLSYMELRDMQEEIGYTKYDEKQKQAQCIQSDNLTDAVVCPTGYLKRSEDDILDGCASAGIPCHGFACLCSPCLKEEGPRDLLALILPTSVLVVIAGILLALLLKKIRDESFWKITRKEIVNTTTCKGTPYVLGHDASVPLFLAEYKGTQVAVKRILLPLKEDQDVTSRSIVPMEMQQSADQPLYQTADAIDAESGSLSLRPEVKVATMTTASKKKATFSSVLQFPGKFGSKAVDRAKLKRLFKNEMKLISKMRHPCIATVLGAVVGNENPEPLLVLEYMERGSLADLLHENQGVLGGDVVLPLLRDIIQGLRFLHASEIVHGDLMAQHILIDSNFRAKLSCCRLSSKNLIAIADRRPTGTPYWMAPEILRHETYNTKASDMYAFGVILYEIFSRKLPYEGEDSNKVLNRVADKQVQKRLPVPFGCPSEAAELMNACFREEPEDRPTAGEIDIRLKMLDINTMGVGVMRSMLARQISQASRVTAPLSRESSAQSAQPLPEVSEQFTME